MKQKNNSYKRILINILMLLLIGIFLFAAWKTVAALRERAESEQFHAQLADSVTTRLPERVPVQVPQETAPLEETAPQPKAEPPIRVDFAALTEENADVTAWLYCPDTPIHYPVVQAADNEYYLRRLMDGTWNAAGTLFLDYRCDADFLDWHSVIYGHNLQDSSMFGTLPQYADQTYYEQHPVIYLLTPEENYELLPFAGFVTKGKDAFFRLPITGEGKAALAEDCAARSDFKAAALPQAEDRLVTLSTCSYAYRDARYVLVCICRSMEEQ